MDTTLPFVGNLVPQGAAKVGRLRAAPAEARAAYRQPRPWFGPDGSDGGSAIGAAVVVKVEIERWFFSANERIAFRAMVLAALRSSTR